MSAQTIEDIKTVRLEALKTSKLDSFRGLLGSSEFGGCFCAVWSSYDDNWVARCKDKSQPNFEITKRNVEAGRHTGYLVYRGLDLVGWTGSGPKTSFPFLQTKLASRLSAFSDDIWSVGCLAVRSAFRGQGLADAIVTAVINEARALGAKMIEAYPVRPFHEPHVFRGTLGLYERMGFSEISFERDGEHEIVLMSLSI